MAGLSHTDIYNYILSKVFDECGAIWLKSVKFKGVLSELSYHSFYSLVYHRIQIIIYLSNGNWNKIRWN